MGKRVSDYLNNAFLPVGTIVLIYLLKAWLNLMFWIVGIFAIGLAFLLDKIPKRFKLLRFLIILALPMFAMIEARVGTNQYLLIDACIFLITIQLLNYRRKKQN
jgi:hypothetical protein